MTYTHLKKIYIVNTIFGINLSTFDLRLEFCFYAAKEKKTKLHELQIISMVTTKARSTSKIRPDSSYEWIEKNFNNHIKNIFMIVQS